MRNLPYLWHRGKPFEKQGRSFTLLMRIATLTDVKRTADGRPPQTRRLWNLPVAKVFTRSVTCAAAFIQRHGPCQCF